MADTTEPAIPVIAPLPLQGFRSLLNRAEVEWPTLTEPGVRVSLDVTSTGEQRVMAVVSVHDIDGALIGRRSYDGWSVGAVVQWTPGKSRKAKP